MIHKDEASIQKGLEKKRNVLGRRGMLQTDTYQPPENLQVQAPTAAEKKLRAEVRDTVKELHRRIKKKEPNEESMSFRISKFTKALIDDTQKVYGFTTKKEALDYIVEQYYLSTASARDKDGNMIREKAKKFE